MSRPRRGGSPRGTLCYAGGPSVLTPGELIQSRYRLVQLLGSGASGLNTAKLSSLHGLTYAQLISTHGKLETLGGLGNVDPVARNDADRLLPIQGEKHVGLAGRRSDLDARAVIHHHRTHRQDVRTNRRIRPPVPRLKNREFQWSSPWRWPCSKETAHA